MRFSVFITLVVATLIACYSPMVTAGKVTNNAEVRRLRGEGVPKSAVNAVFKASNTLNDQLIQVKAFNKIIAANGDEAAIKAAIRMVAINNSPGISKEQAAKYVSEAIAQGAMKNPKSWPRLKKFAKITLGAAVGGLAIYGAYELLTKNTAAAVDTTTTTGSA